MEALRRNGGGYFADDSVPSILDPIDGYSALGFNRDGILVCPNSEPGACCQFGGGCTITSPESCGGYFVGGPCDPNPCPAQGACCLTDGTCVVIFEPECEAQGGVFHGNGVGCNPVPCGLETTITLTDIPDPSMAGEPVNFTYAIQTEDGGTPTGTVTVTDGIGHTCIGTVADGACIITMYTNYNYPFRAFYSGDDVYGGCISAPQDHEVLRAATITTITSDDPDPSAPNQPVVVRYTVEVVPPGGGAPEGYETVTVTDGVDSCTGTVGAGQCTIQLTTSGARSLTATYNGMSVYMPSTSAPEEHTVTGTPPTGACCLMSGECRILSQTDCLAEQGTYQGDGAPCDPNPCPPPTPVMRMSWGRVKSTYQ